VIDGNYLGTDREFVAIVRAIEAHVNLEISMPSTVRAIAKSSRGPRLPQRKSWNSPDLLRRASDMVCSFPLVNPNGQMRMRVCQYSLAGLAFGPKAKLSRSVGETCTRTGAGPELA